MACGGAGGGFHQLLSYFQVLSYLSSICILPIFYLVLSVVGASKRTSTDAVPEIISLLSATKSKASHTVGEVAARSSIRSPGVSISHRTPKKISFAEMPPKPFETGTIPKVRLRAPTPRRVLDPNNARSPNPIPRPHFDERRFLPEDVFQSPSSPPGFLQERPTALEPPSPAIRYQPGGSTMGIKKLNSSSVPRTSA